EAYYEAHPKIWFDTLYHEYTYQIVAVFLSSVQAGSTEDFDFYDYIRIESKEDFEAYVNGAKEASLYDDAICVREMYARGFEFAPIDIYKAKANRFQIVDGKLMPSLQTINGMGEKAAFQAEEEAKTAEFVSVNDYKNRTKIPQSVIETMQKLGLLGNLPQDEQLSFEDFFKGWEKNITD
ncbi:MAG: PolC-type DNA polymerase III, partial [Lachnospiraceae bacterium]|nr:PolC-type DNA polymerase III [Lachnospiraceae bacterium]